MNNTNRHTPPEAAYSDIPPQAASASALSPKDMGLTSNQLRLGGAKLVGSCHDPCVERLQERSWRRFAPGPPASTQIAFYFSRFITV